jgi:hypothetical protein
LERGQQLKRLKAFYEAEHPQTKKGGDKQTKEVREKLSAESALSFAKTDGRKYI